MTTSIPVPLSIIGQYKCGTSWLLSILCHHPNLIGIREFDMVRAVLGDPKGERKLLSRPERLLRFFSTTPWASVPQALLEETDSLESIDAVNRWATRLHRKWGAGDLASAQDHLIPKTFFDLELKIAANFLTQVRCATAAEELIQQFLAAIATYAEDAEYAVVKAADQVAMFDSLKQLVPNGKCVLITRDGRDAAISALHYRQLMLERGAAWTKQERDLQGHLKGWVSRARSIKQLLEAGEEIYVLRYEDLSHNFKQEVYSLFKWLNLDASSDLIDHIQTLTSFEHVTGRSKGTEAKEVVRKGITGEWMEVLSEQEKLETWKTAGEMLEYLGYSQTGELRDWQGRKLLAIA